MMMEILLLIVLIVVAVVAPPHHQDQNNKKKPLQVNLQGKLRRMAELRKIFVIFKILPIKTK